VGGYEERSREERMVTGRERELEIHYNTSQHDDERREGE
jgi:hypothetical protein